MTGDLDRLSEQRFTENLDVLAAAALAPAPEVGKQIRTVTELGAEQIERFIPGVGLLVFQNADVGQWLTKKNEPAKKAKRTYTLTSPTGNEYDMDSVSSVIGCLDKYALRGWYEDHGARGAVKAYKAGELEDVPEDEIIGRVRMLGLGAQGALSDASARGNAVHAVFERRAAGEPAPSLSEFPVEWHPWLMGAEAAWAHLDPDPVEVEQIICHPGDRYAGRFDIVARVDGKLTLLDYKTGKGKIYREAHFQTRLYERARRFCGFEPCERILIVGVGDDGSCYFSECEASNEDVESLLRIYRTLGRIDKALSAQRSAEKKLRRAA